MVFFLIIFIFLFILIAARGFGSPVVPIMALSVIAGIRGNVGYDTCKYKALFSEVLTGNFSFIEPAFLSLVWLVRHITNEPQLFLMLIAAIQGVLLYFIAKQTPNKFLWLGIFTAVFYYSFFFSTLRNGLASLLLILTYSQYLNKRPVNQYAAIFSPLFHFTALPELILIFPRTGLVIILAGVAVLFLPFEYFVNSISNDFFRISLGKFINLSNGLYEVEVHTAWHVITVIAATQLLIMLTVKGRVNKLLFTFIVTGAGVADIYFGRIGRVQIFGLLALTLVHCRDWRVYRTVIKVFIVIVYFYYSYSFTIYPIVFGGSTQQAFSESIETESGNYHIWLFNDKNLCRY